MADEKKPVPEYRYGKYSNYQRVQTNKYNKANYKTITVRFRAYGGECPARDVIQAAAELSGESLNSFCERVLAEKSYEILNKHRKLEID